MSTSLCHNVSIDRKLFWDLTMDGSYNKENLTTMYTQLGVALVWLGEGEEAEKYLKKALDQSKRRQVMHC